MTDFGHRRARGSMESKVPQLIEKAWSHELLFALTSKYAGKVFIKKGHRLSLQYHDGKDETIYVHKGKGLVAARPA